MCLRARCGSWGIILFWLGISAWNWTRAESLRGTIVYYTALPAAQLLEQWINKISSREQSYLLQQLASSISRYRCCLSLCSLVNIRGKDEKIIQFTFFPRFAALRRSLRKSCRALLETKKKQLYLRGKCWHYHHVSNHLNGCDVCHASAIMFHMSTSRYVYILTYVRI